jgi:predicted nucleic acid-binding protein
MLFKVYNELNQDYKVIIDNTFYDKGFKILINEFNKNKERIPLFDCVYIALMEELGIKEIASFDKHFNNKNTIDNISITHILR